MDARDVTLEDIERFEQEIARFYKLRKLFLGIGWGCIGLGLLLIPAAVVIGMNGSEIGSQAMIYLISFALAGGIICFILRGALFNRRIRTRKLLIAEARKYQQDKQLFNNEQ